MLITRGGSGIELALGKAFAERGNHVIAAGRHAQKLKVAEAKALSTVPVDMSDAAIIQTLATTVTLKSPRINVVIQEGRPSFVRAKPAVSAERHRD